METLHNVGNFVDDGDDDDTQEDPQSPLGTRHLAEFGNRTDPEQWCEETSGDQTIYDATYEQNEDLVPWMQTRCKHWGVE